MSLRQIKSSKHAVSGALSVVPSLDQVLQLGQTKQIAVKSINGYYAWPIDPSLYANVMTIFQEAMDSIANADAYLNDTSTTYPRNMLEEAIFKLCRSLEKVYSLFPDIQDYNDATIMYNDLLGQLRNRLFLFSNKISTWRLNNPGISYEDLISKCNLLMNPSGPDLRRNLAVIPNSQLPQPPRLQRQSASRQFRPVD